MSRIGALYRGVATGGRGGGAAHRRNDQLCVWIKGGVASTGGGKKISVLALPTTSRKQDPTDEAIKEGDFRAGGAVTLQNILPTLF